MTAKILYSALSNTGYTVFHGSATDNKSKPYIIYNKTTETIENHLKGSINTSNCRFQVDLYSDSYSECKQIEGVVRLAIENITDAKPIIYSISDMPDNGYVRIKIDMKLWK